MNATTARRGQHISDLLAHLQGHSTCQVTLSGGDLALLREGLCLLAREHAAQLGHVHEVAAARASRPHEVAPLDVHDRMGRPCTAATRASYPLNATCGVCNEPAQCNAGPDAWYHPGRPAGWPVVARPVPTFQA